MLAVLLRHQVRFVIVGGYGAMVHRIDGLEPTTDIDICPLLDDENITRLREALAEMHAEPFFDETARPTSLIDLFDDPDGLRQAKAVMLVTEWGALDLVIRPDGISQGYRTLEPQVEILSAVDPDGRAIDLEVPVASVHHIYLSKKEAGRPKDLRALPHLAKAFKAKLIQRQLADSPDPPSESSEETPS